jgi:hypothetical protein
MPIIAPFRQPGTKLNKERTGIKRLSALWWAQTLEEADVCGDSELIGLPLVNRSVDEHQGAGSAGGYDVTLGYEGLNSEPTVAEQEEFDGSFREEPIESHPLIREIIAYYGGTVDEDSGRIVFPQTMPTRPKARGISNATVGFSNNAQVGLSGGKRKRSTPERNPLFGMSSFPVMQVVFRRTYATKTLRSALLKEVGKIRKQLPKGFEALDDNDFDWLVQPPKVKRRGNCYEVTEELLRGPEGGWPEAIHRLIATGAGE